MNRSPHQYMQVEHPFIERLQLLGWEYLEGDTGVPDLPGRFQGDPLVSWTQGNR